MNYIWDLLIQAEEQGFRRSDIYFTLATSYSPYMELSPQVLNTTTIEQTVQINPYYRYVEIFKDLFPPDNSIDVEIQSYLLDIVIHFLADIDRMQGMNYKEYLMRFLLQEFAANVFGSDVQQYCQALTKTEREIVALNMIRMYQTGDALYNFKDTLKKLFPYCAVYIRSEDKDEVLLYIGQQRTAQRERKIQLIRTLFMPINFTLDIYWAQHFGIVDVEDTMKIDHIALY
ncbi:iron-dependent peroxidase [Metasolibacillus meyeri]|uniref:Iron-dependent peroxidase n=1 Tax=Metasolibacillus meyeri TaxID=1071052 RepID=A0AAW9NXV0_9BACL|nr:iron-dependent peroxidase [Metasolibacillus meyeri]MEC1180048.1 iron-dependent peroxidase [Metasolibacillus meyeri]